MSKNKSFCCTSKYPLRATAPNIPDSRSIALQGIATKALLALWCNSSHAHLPRHEAGKRCNRNLPNARVDLCRYNPSQAMPTENYKDRGIHRTAFQKKAHDQKYHYCTNSDRLD
jgi:hypothetical protein